MYFDCYFSSLDLFFIIYIANVEAFHTTNAGTKPPHAPPRMHQSVSVQFDLAGFPKAQATWYQAKWLLRSDDDRADKTFATSGSSVVHLVESWEKPRSVPPKPLLAHYRRFGGLRILMHAGSVGSPSSVSSLSKSVGKLLLPLLLTRVPNLVTSPLFRPMIDQPQQSNTVATAPHSSNSAQPQRAAARRAC